MATTGSWEHWFLEKTVEGLIGQQFSEGCKRFEYVVSNISKKLSQAYTVVGFFELDIDTICQILSNDDLQVSSEVEVFRLALKWMNHIMEERTQYMQRLMKCVRFRHMASQELIECYAIVKLMKEKSSMREVFLKTNGTITAGIVEQLSDPLNVPDVPRRSCFSKIQEKKELPLYFFNVEPFYPEKDQTQVKDAKEYVNAQKDVPNIQENQKKMYKGSVYRGLKGKIKRLLDFVGLRKRAKSKTFGVTLAELVKKAPKQMAIPFIVMRLGEYLKEKGFKHEGIFQGGAILCDVQKMKKEFDDYGDAYIENKDIKVVSGLFELFFMELAEPLIPENIAKNLVDILKDYKNDTPTLIFKTRQEISKLEKNNWYLLNYIIHFLAQVTKEEDTNKMGPMDLARVFRPAVLRCGQGLEGSTQQGNTTQEILVVVNLVNHHSALFRDDFEFKPENIYF